MPRGKAEDLSGNVFGKLTAYRHIGSVRQSQVNRYQPALWLCYCDCGYPVAKTSDQLKKSRSIKCYNCKQAQKNHSNAMCALSKTLDGVETFLDRKSKLFSQGYKTLPCSQAKDIRDQLRKVKLPGKFKIISQVKS